MGSGLTTNEQTDFSKNAVSDVNVVDIERRGDKMTRIVNTYDQRDGEISWRPARRLDWQRIIRQGGGGTVLAGDVNAHSQHWDPRCTGRRDCTYWEEIIDEHGLVIANWK